jgi:site-specific DNA-cytosine methylase
VRYLSVCSGIEAATEAWHELGWLPEAFSEIEPFPCAVLKHHYPEVPNLGDMTKFKEWNIGPIDLLVGGTPCQSFSVAGLREGLADPRGNLMLTCLAIARRHRPRWLVWENVPGVLSSNGGEDFACVLRGLAELGYGFATESLTLSTSEWPSDGVACSLSDTLETGTLPPRYYLSALACRGILRRAEKRGKELPPALYRALQTVSQTECTKE